MRRFVYVLFFVAFTTENVTMYGGGLWKTFMGTVDALLFQPSPIKLPLFFVAVLVCLVVGASAKARQGRAQPMDRAISGTLLSLLVFTIWGAIMGGKPWTAGWQLMTLVMSLSFGKLLLATMRSPEHFETLGKVFLAAAYYRATMCLTFWYFFVHNVYYPKGPPPHMTTHDDSVIFVGAILVALANLVVRRTFRAARFAVVTLAVMVLCIQLNNRRLAWASLVFALVVVYAVLPAGRVRRKANVILMTLAPIVGTYISVGWGRTEKIFKPLAAFSSMTTKEDSSTRSRNAENKGLHMTLYQYGLFVSRGWGQEYIEVDNRFNIGAFYSQWKYIPHNSVLGILAFTGVFGFASMWMSMPVAVYLNARTWRNGKHPVERIAGLSGIAGTAICINQMYGDMGLQSITTQVTLASTYAIAGRLSVSSGAWPDTRASKATRQSAPVARSGAPAQSHD